MNPYMKFYPDAWLGDTPLQNAHPATRGGWANIMCYLHDAEPRGVLSAAEWRMQQFAGLDNNQWKRFKADQSSLKFCNMTIKGGNVIITSRRMEREEHSLQTNRDRVAKSRAKAGGNADVTPESPPPIATTKEASKETSLLKTKPKENIARKSERFILAKGGKKLNGFMLDLFVIIWHLYDHKHNRAEAAQAFMQIKFPAKTDDGYQDLVMRLIYGAKKDRASRWDREQNGVTIMYLQGWLNNRRWENYDDYSDEEIKNTPIDVFNAKFQTTLITAEKTTRFSK